MTIKNKKGITDSALLARVEEKISKQKALLLYEQGILDKFGSGSFEELQKIHAFLFDELYEFAGKIRTVNLAKGNFRFASVLYLSQALGEIDKMPQSNFDEIIAKYVEMNVAHPFREGNGRSMRIWLNCMLKKGLGLVVDWSRIDKEDYLLAMERSPIKDLEIKTLLQSALTNQVDNKLLYMKGIDSSYYYEGYHAYSTENLE